MTTNFERVKQFHEVYEVPMPSTPGFPADTRIDLRMGLIYEELEELEQALQEDNLVEAADALTDLLYVVYGTGLEFGIDLDKCFEEVHRSNLSKLGADGKPIRRADQKILKGPNFFQPNLAKVLGV